MDRDNNNLEKNNISFLDKILNQLYELDFSNIKNLMVVILGITSPLLPLIFLYRRDLVKELELTGVLIFALIINSILIIFDTIIYKIKCKKDLELMLIRAKIISKNTEDLINSNQLSNIYVLNKNNQLDEQLDKIEKAEQSSQQIKNNLDILKNICKTIKLRLNEIKNEKSYENNSFEMAFLNNIVIGLIVIIVKFLSYLNICNISLKNLVIIIFSGYCGGIVILISTILKLKYNEIKLKRISK